MAKQNYGTTTYPCIMDNPLPTRAETNPTFFACVQEACAGAATQLKDLYTRNSGHLWTGSAVPTTADYPAAIAGDLYIQSDGTNATYLYELTETSGVKSWTARIQLKGATGSAGTNGTNGTNGDDGDDGVGISTATINASGHLILTKTDSTTVDAGVAKGADGTNGTNGTDGVGSGWTTSEVTGTTPSVTFAHGYWYRCTDVGITTLTVTNGLTNVGDVAVVWFTSPSGTASTYSAPSTIYHKGDACSSGTFTPTAGHRYTVTYMKDDGGIVGLVMEV